MLWMKLSNDEWRLAGTSLTIRRKGRGESYVVMRRNLSGHMVQICNGWLFCRLDKAKAFAESTLKEKPICNIM